MRQDLHEAIIGFICSSQSNIQKIRMNLHLLAQSSNNSIQDHAFLPRPGVALSEEIVRNAKTGYRSKFICATNVLLTKEFLEKVANASYEESHDILCSLPGIGPKIADCICLFSLGHGEAFPVDVHIARAMRAKFPHAKLNDEKSIKCFAQKRWGNDAGLAQQFLFQWARDMRKDLIA
jgi:N-glycosylase/DNA lyase